MKQLAQFIQEKLKINSKSNISKNNHLEDYCVCIVYNDLYQEFDEYFSDSCIHSDVNADAFICNVYDIESYINCADLYAYKIPEKYNSLEEFEEDYQEGLINPDDDLEEFDFRGYFK